MADRGVGNMAHLRVGEDGGRNNLVGAEGLTRVDKRRQDLAALFAFRCYGLVSSSLATEQDDGCGAGSPAPAKK